MRNRRNSADGNATLLGSLDGAAAVRQRQTTQELVVNFLRDAILSNRLRGGSHLIQDKIATELSVSRVPVREALLQLEAEGLVHMEAHRGASVVWLPPEEIEEIFEIRRLLVTEAIRKVVPHLTDDQVKRLQKIARRQESESNMEVRLKLNGAFYATLFENLNRTRMRYLMEKLEREVERYLVPLDRPHLGHQALVAACEARQAEEAATIVAEHLARVCDRVLAAVRDLGEGELPVSRTRRRRGAPVLAASGTR
ncbi:MAG: GntR family transcriptional regulator [Chloroflexi bacterium]|nr:GntR family transcriptional regulator [Chloroflexota bacterium]